MHKTLNSNAFDYNIQFNFQHKHTEMATFTLTFNSLCFRLSAVLEFSRYQMQVHKLQLRESNATVQKCCCCFWWHL